MTAFKPKQLIVVTLWAEDIPTTVHFYRDMIGLELLAHQGAQPTFIVGEGMHLLIKEGKPLPALGAEPFPVIAFEVDDLDEAFVHLEALGINFASEIISNPGARYILFHDPAGNLIELAQLASGVH